MLMKRVELTSFCGFLNGAMYWDYKVSATSAGSVISLSLVFFFLRRTWMLFICPAVGSLN